MKIKRISAYILDSLILLMLVSFLITPIQLNDKKVFTEFKEHSKEILDVTADYIKVVSSNDVKKSLELEKKVKSLGENSKKLQYKHRYSLYFLSQKILTVLLTIVYFVINDLGDIMKSIRTQDAVGQILLHDLVRIVIGEVKDTPFRRGHVITEEDIPKLLDLGKEHVFVMEPEDEGFLHEEDVARALYHMAGGENMHDGPMAQGKIEAIADVDGLFKVDVDRLHAINSIGELTIVTKFNNTPVKAGDKLAGMRCIPLLLEEQQVEAAKKIANGEPLLHVKPFVRKTMGIVTTGSEVFEGRIKDAFTPIIEERCAEFGVTKVAHEIVTDNTDDIVAAIDKVKAAGADIIFCTGGMSVDPDDLTPGAIKRYADRVVTYGLPVLPGSMVCIAYCADGTPILGVPGGVLFSKPTAFDEIVPRLIADDEITKEDCIAMGHGGFLG